jgi:hypothetical protein
MRERARILVRLTGERASCRLERRAAHKLAKGYGSRTVEDHCPQLHLSVDERFDDTGVVRSDAKMRRRQAEVED